MTRYEVEWLTDVPVVDGIGEPDEGVTHAKHFASLAAAQAWAKKVRSLDYWDGPLITEQTRVRVDHGDGVEWVMVRQHAVPD